MQHLFSRALVITQRIDSLNSPKIFSVIATFTILTPALAQAPITVSFKDGAPTPILGAPYTGTQDAFIWTNENSGHANANSGASNRMDVGTFNGFNTRRHSLVRFDVTALNGQYQSITSATLRLHIEVNYAGSETVDIYHLTSANADWVEGSHQSDSSINPPFNSGTSVWNAKILGVAGWAGSVGASTPNIDYVNTIAASNSFSSANVAGSFLDFTFVDATFLPDWINGSNNGLLMKTRFETGNNRIAFSTSDSVELSVRPELLVTYTALVAAPEPSAMALLLPGVFIGMGIVRRNKTNAS